jgi:tetratricopeptide (TPR) repeat protein/predicted Ser/Thr protein kinase
VTTSRGSLAQWFERGLDIPTGEREAWASQIPDPADRRRILQLLAASGTDAALDSTIASACAAAFEPLHGPGTRIGAYRLVEEIGRGGNGVVFLAERADDQFRQRVAVKLLRAMDGRPAADRLRDERQILASLSHPNIARLMDGGETAAGQPYLVMEYVAGEPIDIACRARRLGLRARVELIAVVAGALHFAHQQLVIHRDIKPENILLGEDARPVLVDFGIAKFLDGTTLSVATQPWCTPAYASPEQRAGRALSTASDLYSLGLVLRKLRDDVRTARARWWSSDDLDRVIARATAEDPEQRYASAAAFADDLQRYLTGYPVLAGNHHSLARAWKHVRRRPLTAAVVTALFATLSMLTLRLAEERSNALEEGRQSAAMVRYLVGLFRSADPASGAGQSIGASALIDEGVRRLSSDRGLGTQERARLLSALGEIYVNMGSPAKAKTVLSQALALSHGLAAEEIVAIHEQLALAAEALQQVAEQRRHYEQAILASGGGPESARLLAGLALAHSRAERHADAEHAIRTAIDLHRAQDGADAIATLQDRIYLAEVLRKAGRLAEAEAEIEPSLAALRRRLAGDDLRLASALGFHGVLLMDLRRWSQADRAFTEALAIREAVLDPASQQIALLRFHLGRLRNEQGRTLEAIEHFEAVLAAEVRSGDAQTLAGAISRLSLGSLYEEVGAYPRAIELLREARRIVDAQDERGVLADMLRQSLGRALMLDAQPREARALLEQPVGENPGADWALQRGRQRIHLAEWHRRYGNIERSQHFLEQAERFIGDIGGPESPRAAAIRRTHGLLEWRRENFAAARARLEQAREMLIASKSPTYIGVGDIGLDLAELALTMQDIDRARAELGTAHSILASQLHSTAPQRARIHRLESALESH